MLVIATRVRSFLTRNAPDVKGIAKQDLPLEYTLASPSIPSACGHKVASVRNGERDSGMCKYSVCSGAPRLGGAALGGAPRKDQKGSQDAASILLGGDVGLYISQLPALPCPAATARHEYDVHSFWKRFNFKRWAANRTAENQ